jgi:hypothetical protein
VDQLVRRAQQFVTEGKPLEALHVVDIALAAEPRSEFARGAKREALERLLEQTGGKNLWERMWIAAELRDLESDATDEARASSTSSLPP